MKNIIAFVAFNNNLFVNALLTSLVVHKNFYDVYIFNNGTEDIDIMPLPKSKLNITILDNRNCDYINYEKFLIDNPPKYSDYWNNNYGSLRHTMALDYMIKNLDYDKIILSDVDVIFKQNLENLLLLDYDLIGETGKNPVMGSLVEERLKPFFFVIKKDCIKDISFFDKNRFLLLSSNRYDTGSSFLEDVINYNKKFLRINIEDYISHFGGGTWYWRGHNNYTQWLHKNAVHLKKKE